MINSVSLTTSRAGHRKPARFSAAVLACGLMFFATDAVAHFLLNVNIRVIHAVHRPDSLRLLVRLPMPYLVADKIGAVDAAGLPQPAPYTYNRMEDGAVMHYFNAVAFGKQPRGLGQLLSDGLVLEINGQKIGAVVGNVRVWSADRQPPFSRLAEAERALVSPFPGGGQFTQTPVGDTVIDVELIYPLGGRSDKYALSSTLDPGLPEQDQTANLIIDHGAGGEEPLIFRIRGLMSKPVVVSRSVLRAAWTFILEGVHHILKGADHILFVLCLLLGAATFVSLAWRITGFTAGHSVTLALGFFGYAPTGPWFVPLIETGIALSIIYAGVDALMRGERRAMTVITALLGLLHGLGFSFVLKEILKADAPNVWQSLLAFNVGVEIGQLVIAALVWPPLWLLAGKWPRCRRPLIGVVALPCIVIAGVWAGERAVQFVSSLQLP